MDAAADRSGNKPAVLLVDDEAPLLDALRQGLEREFALDVAANARDAELLMTTRRYDVVVCDHLMPGEEGLQFLVRCAQRHPGTQRILLTGYLNPELLTRSVAVAQLASCLIKPVRMAELAKAIRDALG
ncbi:response regulator [Opitutus sp. ER46]|uniref:response regulator n=1 Tax=Opitutus sp. ER46 TaxID=2161864 RepID=UPI000D316277|nr:response regulator [Opitutus sp. ER46]PTX98958.1 hypothetical protein DB354_02745 [Opitutus sp. ER46]